MINMDFEKFEEVIKLKKEITDIDFRIRKSSEKFNMLLDEYKGNQAYLNDVY